MGARPHSHPFTFYNLFALVIVSILLFCTHRGNAQIYNGGVLVDSPSTAHTITHDVPPDHFPGPSTPTPSITSPSPAVFTIYVTGNIPTNDTTINITTIPTSAPTTSYLPPVPVQPFTVVNNGSATRPHGLFPLPTSPAWFPQNISSCTMCYGQFQTLSRCNVIANSEVFPVTNNTTYADLMPFLRCICAYKAIDMYPHCIDCFNQTQQLNQLNVLQANHFESYHDAFRQLCGATQNGNKIPGAAASIRVVMSGNRWHIIQLVLAAAVSLLVAIVI